MPDGIIKYKATPGTCVRSSTTRSNLGVQNSLPEAALLIKK